MLQFSGYTHDEPSGDIWFQITDLNLGTHSSVSEEGTEAGQPRSPARPLRSRPTTNPEEAPAIALGLPRVPPAVRALSGPSGPESLGNELGRRRRLAGVSAAHASHHGCYGENRFTSFASVVGELPVSDLPPSPDIPGPLPSPPPSDMQGLPPAPPPPDVRGPLPGPPPSDMQGSPSGPPPPDIWFQITDLNLGTHSGVSEEGTEAGQPRYSAPPLRSGPTTNPEEAPALRPGASSRLRCVSRSGPSHSHGQGGHPQGWRPCDGRSRRNAGVGSPPDFTSAVAS